ncbi:MAG: hypothetical protein GMKNLPBB_02077 [Myxococcota bacterium]|nr:hypothetical protein [Myxococcota bacterium]
MKKIMRTIVVFGVLALLAACSDSGSSDAGGGADSGAAADSGGGDSGAAADTGGAPKAMREEVSKSGLWKVGYMPSMDPIPLNQPFELRVSVKNASSGAPFNNGKVTVDARMPAHGHGMKTKPETSFVGDGVYLAKGMQLHMPGEWMLDVTIAGEGGAAETVSARYDCCKSP